MTCIIGVEVGDKVVIGGDIQGSGRNNKIVHTQPKVFKNGDMGFGYTSSYRFGQIIEHSMTKDFVPTTQSQIYPWLVKEFVPHCQNELEKGKLNGGGNCLIGVQGQLWELQSDFSILRSVNGINAVGSGYEYALGAMHTYLKDRDIRNMTTDEVIPLIHKAMETVSTFCPTVGSACTTIVI